MKRSAFLLLTTIICLPLTSLFTGCVTQKASVPAHMSLRMAPVGNKSNVKVRVSLNNRAVYVYEGDKCIWAAATAIGKVDSPTPTGPYTVFRKMPRKRSNTYGFHVKGDDIRPGKSSQTPAGYRYVGYPMPNWVEFKAGYGFHSGAVWPQPRTKGCLRLHRTISAEFFNLVEIGTPIYITSSLPEDATIGKNIPRPSDFSHPDSPPSVLITDRVFDDMSVYF